MKKIAKRIDQLGQRAAAIRQAVETMPAKTAELREAVTATAGQMQQLRADLTAGVAALRPSTEADTLATLREIDLAADVLGEAGYLLGGVDYELGVVRRVRVRLVQAGAVELATLRSLLAAHAHRAVLKMLLSGIVQATELAEKVEFRQLDFAEVVVELGAGQTVRVGWRAEPVAVPIAANPPATSEVRPPTFSQSSFFARPAVAVEAATAATAPVALATPEAAKPKDLRPAGQAAPAATTPDWRVSALDRFKKMPDLSKRPSR